MGSFEPTYLLSLATSRREKETRGRRGQRPGTDAEPDGPTAPQRPEGPEGEAGGWRGAGQNERRVGAEGEMKRRTGAAGRYPSTEARGMRGKGEGR